MHLTGSRFQFIRRSPKESSGIVLLEALVTIVVLAFGLLSVAGLQLASMTHQKRSRSLEIASEAILDITERARTNPAGIRLGAYRYEDTYAAASVAVRTIDSCRSSGTCTPGQTAANDIAAWSNAVRSLLPGGAVSLVPDGSAFVATVMWLDKDRRNDTAAAATALAIAETCTASSTSTPWRNCCPEASHAPAGVRCLRNYFLP